MDDRYSLARDFAENVDVKQPPAEVNGSFFDPGRQLFDCRRATEGIYILGESLLGVRHIGRDESVLVFVLHVLRDSLRSCLSDDRRGQRMRRAAMAGVASYLALPLKVFLVDGEHHLHHLPRHLLWLLIVLFKCSFHVAEAAFHSEGGGYKLHRGDQSVRRNTLQDLNILVSFFRHLCFGCRWFSWASLPAHGNTRQRKCNNES